MQTEGHERRRSVPPGFHPAAAASQRQREGAGGLVRASPHGPAEAKAGRGGSFEKLQGASSGPEGQHGASERRRTETGGAEIQSRGEDRSLGGRKG